LKYFLHAFRRRADGSWLSIATTWLDGPHGRIQVDRGSVFTRGTAVDGFDVAAWLDEASGVRRGAIEGG
jgi:hypothetical protein